MSTSFSSSSSSSSSSSFLDILATGLGYIVGLGSFSLYAPIIVRLCRRKALAARGLTIITWWLKVISYTCTLLYCYVHGYALSTYIEVLVIMIEATIILLIVFYYQQKLSSSHHGDTYTEPLSSASIDIDENANDVDDTDRMTTNIIHDDINTSNNNFIHTETITIGSVLTLSYYQLTFYGIAIAYILWLILGLNGILPSWILSSQQGLATILVTLAIIPQLLQNYNRKSMGDYSPISTLLAIFGCSIRMFTTIQLNHSDILLLLSYFIPLLIYIVLIIQIFYYGTIVEKLSYWNVLTSDVRNKKRRRTSDDPPVVEDGENIPNNDNEEVEHDAFVLT